MKLSMTSNLINLSFQQNSSQAGFGASPGRRWGRGRRARGDCGGEAGRPQAGGQPGRGQEDRGPPGEDGTHSREAAYQ